MLKRARYINNRVLNGYTTLRKMIDSIGYLPAGTFLKDYPISEALGVVSGDA